MQKKEFVDKLMVYSLMIATFALCGIFLCCQLKACPDFVIELIQPTFVVGNLGCAISLLIKNKINGEEMESHAEFWLLYIWLVTLLLLRTNWSVMAPIMFVLRIALQVVLRYALTRLPLKDTSST